VVEAEGVEVVVESKMATVLGHPVEIALYRVLTMMRVFLV
jgi:hypothetical protein